MIEPWTNIIAKLGSLKSENKRNQREFWNSKIDANQSLI